MSEKLLNKKIKITLPESPNVDKFDFDGKEIVVKSHIDRFDKVDMLLTYYDYFFESEGDAVTRYLTAKYSFMLAVLNNCTNIHTQEGSIDLDAVIYSGLWKEIIKRIDNFNVVTKDLYGFIKMVSEERAVKESLGNIIDRLYSSITSFIDDLDQDKLKEYVNEFKDGLKSLENNGIVLPDNLSQKEKE